ncbi:MAG: hypothetical protein FJ363_07350 [Gemmatimonadetes bacterium]|nr:hypothetical protein [Gemmatimonadota bacterium]
MAPSRVDELKHRYEENPRRFFAPLANEYRKAGDLDAAIDLCRMHLEEQPGHLSGHIVYAQALFESSRPAEAKVVFEAAIQLDPENLIALRHLGDIARHDSDAATAKHWYQRVLEADPRNEEVTALIASLEATAAPSVVVEAPLAPPPPPNYAEQDVAPTILTEPAVVDASAPTPVVPTPSVLATPRLSIGLLDLDLNLADSTAPAVDLLGAVTSPAAPPPAAEPPAPEVHEPPPTMEAGFEMTDGAEPAPSLAEASVEGIDESPLAATPPAEIEVQDTSFDAPPADESSMFGTLAEPPAFGDGLDVTATVGVTDETPPRISLLDSLPLVDTGDVVAIGEPITEPRPVPPSALSPPEPAPEAPALVDAVPEAVGAAPATPADFDALFGNAPISDAVIGGGEATAPTDEAGFVADSFVGREPTDELLESAPGIETPPSPFVTETMAELYLQQGFREEALGVYRQLLAQNPEDAGLAERVKHLEHGTRSSLAIDSVSEQIEADAVAEEVRRTGSIPTVPAAPADTAAPVEPAEVAAPDAPVQAAALAEPAASAEPAAPAQPALPPAPTGPTAREVFARIAARRAIPGVATDTAVEAPVAADESTSAPVSAAPAAASVDAPPSPVTEAVALQPAATGIAPGGQLDQLFGMAGVLAEDEGAALALSAAYGGAPAAPIRGEPTRRVTDELSLESVFKDETPQRAAGVQRQSTRLRFDQFFSGGEGGEPPAPSPSPASQAAPAEDVAQFTDWLKGLKGS